MNGKTMHDLFGCVDDPVTEAARMLAQHDLVVVPGSVMRDCLNVLHILVCDCESVEEAMETQALIHHIEAAWEIGMPSNVEVSGPEAASSPEGRARLPGSAADATEKG